MRSKSRLRYLCAEPFCSAACSRSPFALVSQLATSPPLCLDPDPRLGKIANTIYRISLPRTPPPLRPKKRKANSLESTEEDEASWNRKAKIIRFMDPKPTRSATPSYALFCYTLPSAVVPDVRCVPRYRLLDHLNRMKTAPPQPPENTATAIAGATFNNNPLHDMPVAHTPTTQPTPQPPSQVHSQTPSQPQPQPQPQPQTQTQTQTQPQPQPQPQPQSQPPSQPQSQPQ